MPTTPNYGFPYPALSDSPNGPAQVQSLASTVDTALKAESDARIAGDNALIIAKPRLYKSGAVTGANVAQFDAALAVCSIAIVNPGVSYSIEFNGSIQMDPGDNTGLDLAIRDGSGTAGTVLSRTNSIDGRVSGNQGGFNNFRVNGSTGVLTGARTVTMVLTKWFGGPGDGYTYWDDTFTGFTALVVPQ